MLKLIRKIDSKFDDIRAVLLDRINPVIDLAGRLLLANIFYKSGMLKLTDFLNGNFKAQVFLFKDTYDLPLISPEAAAYFSMGGELVFSILFAIGLATRLSALALMVMSGLAIFVFPDVYEHYLWALIAASILCRGAGPISLDRILFRIQ